MRNDLVWRCPEETAGIRSRATGLMTSIVGWRQAFESAVMASGNSMGRTGNICTVIRNRRSLELALTGEPLNASRAHAIGLINRVYSDSEFDTSAESYVAALAVQSATAMNLSKELLYNTDGMTFEASIEAGVQANIQARKTDDFKRGVERFLKKS